MKTFHLRKLLLLACLLFFINTVHSQKAIFMLRHAERVAYDNSDNDLSPAGLERAVALANLLKNAGIKTIYTSIRKRAIQTAAPLADSLDIQPIPVPGVDTAYSLDMLKRFSQLPEHEVVLVIGHIDTFIPLIHMMGYKEEIKLEDFEHDDIFVVIPQEGNVPIVIRLNYGAIYK